MKIDQTSADGIAVLALSGQFDRTEADRLVTHVDVLLEEGQSKVLVDLSATTLVNSTGFGAFLVSCRRLRDAGGDLVLVGLRSIVMRAFTLLELDGKIPAFATMEEAQAYLKSVDAPPRPVDGDVPVAVESDADGEFSGTLQTVSEREVQFTVATGECPLLKKGDKLQIRFTLPDAGEVDAAHLVIAGVMPTDGANLIHARFDLLPMPARETIRRFGR